MISFPFYTENGGQRPRPTTWSSAQGLTSRILSTREPLLLNRPEHWEAIGSARVGKHARSYLGVPDRASATTRSA